MNLLHCMFESIYIFESFKLLKTLCDSNIGQEIFFCFEYLIKMESRIYFDIDKWQKKKLFNSLILVFISIRKFIEVKLNFDFFILDRLYVLKFLNKIRKVYPLFLFSLYSIFLLNLTVDFVLLVFDIFFWVKMLLHTHTMLEIYFQETEYLNRQMRIYTWTRMNTDVNICRTETFW